MKSFRKIFIAALAVLFGSWVNMQAQDALSMEGNTISKTVRHKSSKSLKQKRVEEFIAKSAETGVAENVQTIKLDLGVSVSFSLGADCSRKGFTVKATDITVNVPDSKPIPLENLENYIQDKTAILNSLEKNLIDLRTDRPGESSDKYNMRMEELNKVMRIMTFNRDMRNSVSKAPTAVAEFLDRFAQYVITGE